MKNHSAKLIIVNGLILFIGMGIFSYIIFKSLHASFTHDESLTYLNFPRDTFMDIISYKFGHTNNHILNTLLMKYSELLFGNSEFVLRLPNILISVFYLVFSFLLFRRTNKILLLIVFILLCTNNLLIDFFALARGYGLSYAFMLMSLYYFINAFEKNRRKNIFLFHIFGLLAVLSHFMLFIFYLSLLFIYFLIDLLEQKFIGGKKYNLLKSLGVHVPPLVVVVSFLYEPIRRVVSNNKFDAGGKSGFFHDTVQSLINSSFHGTNLSPLPMIIAQILFIALVVFTFFIIVIQIWRKNELFITTHWGLIITNFLLITISLAIILMHFTGSDYPINRFCLYLYPLYIIHLGFFFHYIIEISYKKFLLIIGLMTAILSLAAFIIKLDMHSYTEWKYDSQTKNILEQLAFSVKTQNRSEIKLGISWRFEPTINYYRITKRYKWLLPVDRKGPKQTDDYYYIFCDEPNILRINNYKVIANYPEINTILLQNSKGYR